MGQQSVPAHPGGLTSDWCARRWAAEDWGRVVRDVPAYVARPRNAEEVAATVRWARDAGLRLRPRGAGHSNLGQAQARGGVVLDTSTMGAKIAIDGDRAVVHAGTRWDQLLGAVLAHGRSFPVWTDYLGLTVGGTVSVGGIGGATHRHGLQTDNVTALRVVTPDGSITWCSPHEQRALFDAVRAGHGAHGVVLEAELRLVPAPTRVRRHQRGYTDLAAYVADQRALIDARRCAHVGGVIDRDEHGRWLAVLDVLLTDEDADTPLEQLAELTGRHVEQRSGPLSYYDFVNEMQDNEALLRSTGSWWHPHPWVNLFLPDSVAHDFAAAALDELTAEDLGADGLVLLYPFHTDLITTPGVALPESSTAFLFAVLRTAPPRDPVSLARMVRANEVLREGALAVGGTVYLER